MSLIVLNETDCLSGAVRAGNDH